MEQYPTLHFLMRHGRLIATIAAVLGIASGAWAAVAFASWPFAVAGILFGVVGYGLVRSYVELIVLVTDMLLPK